MIGTYGLITFATSSNKLFTFKNFGKSNEAVFAEHKIIGKKATLEFVAPGLEEITMDIRLDIAHGNDPVADIASFRDIRDRGDAQPMTIGGYYIGDFVIMSVSETWQTVTNKGVLVIANITVTFKEYADDRV